MSMESTLLVIFLTTLLATSSAAQSSLPTKPSFFYGVCDEVYGNNTSNSTYATNLTTVLTALQQQSSIQIFYSTSTGSVYGQYYCRFDVDSALCSACVLQASNIALRGCPNFKSAIIWFDVCSLRYRNVSMYGLLDIRWVSYDWSTDNVTDPGSFSVVLNSTLDALIKEAAYSDDFRKFAVSKVAVSTFESAYFLVECSPDLNATECETCLLGTDDYVNRCCGNWPVNASVYFSSCEMRYSDSLFYTTPLSPPPPPQVFSSPPPPLSDILPLPPPPITTSFPPSNGKTKASSGKVKVGLARSYISSHVDAAIIENYVDEMKNLSMFESSNSSFVQE